MINSNDTIAAVSTAMNNSGIGIIRISGDKAFDIIKKIFRPANKDKDISRVSSHTVHYGNIVDIPGEAAVSDGSAIVPGGSAGVPGGSAGVPGGSAGVPGGSAGVPGEAADVSGKSAGREIIVDEVLVLIMKGPHTYTREDTVEIDSHGGMFVMNRILELVLKAGARTAEPGEFTKRAFLNGRIDLTQAEAVIDVINAENNYALNSAVTQLKGSVSAKVRMHRTTLLEQIAYIEAALDDPEHIELDNYGTALLPVLNDISVGIDELVKTANDGRIIKEGINTVILGKPNAGKSSLLNALVGSDRAIVTEIAGTTRDVLEESIRLGDVTLNVFDTAGIRSTDDVVERIGVDKAREYALKADLIVWIIDSSRSLDEDDYKISEIIRDKKTVILMNKMDLPEMFSEEDVAEKLLKGGLAGNGADSDVPAGIPILKISAETREGIDEFTKTVREMFYSREINFNDQVFITNQRQKEALIKAEESLDKAILSIKNQMPEDFYTIDMMDAYTWLGKVIGEAVEDDLADEIFSKFCMGK